MAAVRGSGGERIPVLSSLPGNSPSISVPCVRRNCLHLSSLLSIHTRSLAASHLSALWPWGPDADLSLAPVLRGIWMGSRLPSLGPGAFGYGPSQGLPHPDPLCCAPQATSAPSPAPRAMEPWRNLSLLQYRAPSSCPSGSCPPAKLTHGPGWCLRSSPSCSRLWKCTSGPAPLAVC